MLDLHVAVEVIEPERILRLIDFTEQSVAQYDPMLRLDAAFEDRILNTLAVVFAGLRDASQTPGAGLVCRRYVISDKNQHLSGLRKRSSSEDGRQVTRDVAAQMP